MFDDNYPAAPSGCPSALVLDQLEAGELDVAKAAACEEHLKTCADCAARRAELQASAAAFLERFPTLSSLPPPKSTTAGPLQLGRAEHRALDEQPLTPPAGQRRAPVIEMMSRRAWPALSVLVAAAAAWLLWIQAPGRKLHLPAADDADAVATTEALSSPPATRAKGTARLAFFVKREGQVLPGSDGMVLHPGDRVRFTAAVTQPRHLAVLSRDAAGSVSVYHEDSTLIVPTANANTHALPSSIELDDVLGEEQIWAVFCEAAVPVTDLVRALRETANVEVPPGCSLDVVSWRKQAR